MYRLLAEVSGTFWEEYLSLLKDGPHWAFEITTMIIIDGIILGILIPIIKSKVEKHDREVHGH